ncbi:Peptidase S10, serine carboxypeptidase [Corchorus olitorius]|uniref:Peptidase S10, serine carboxypeptidase n=1 Tax=Corchorus olitorius TaxID=93759 RepID=A0A1R3KQ45_9ROSI|nr:Peptidase S10, serine carboxypeptidase [Corchorus olitorius]
MANSKWDFVPKTLLVLISLYLFLGSCVNATSWEDSIAQQKLDKVQKLPGQTFNVSFAHYAGYVTVNEDSGRALFYWFFEAAEDPVSKPLLLWLNGGVASKRYLSYSYRYGSKNCKQVLTSANVGHYVPQLSQAIVRHNSAVKEKAINLKGYMVGNALTDDYHDHVGVFQFMWAAGLISDETYKLLNVLCDHESFVRNSNACDKILDVASEELGNIDPYSIYTPPCSANVSQSKGLLKSRLKAGQLSEKYDPCTERHSEVYFNLPEVQKALHVLPEVAPSKWETCNDIVNEHWKDSPKTVLDVYRELIHVGLRIWIFSGDTDAVIPVTSTRYSIDALKLPTVSHWRAWYDDDGQVGGWTQEYAGLNFVSVRGAGHEVPLHRPKQALTLVKAFLSGTPMPDLKLVSDS